MMANYKREGQTLLFGNFLNLRQTIKDIQYSFDALKIDPDRTKYIVYIFTCSEIFLHYMYKLYWV